MGYIIYVCWSSIVLRPRPIGYDRALHGQRDSMGLQTLRVPTAGGLGVWMWGAVGAEQ